MAILDKLKNVTKPKVELTVSNRTIVRVILWIVGFVILFKFIGRVEHILTLIAISAFLALALNPVVSWLTHKLKSKSRARATAGAYLIVVTFIVLFLALVIPPLARQSSDFIRNVPNTINDFKTQDSTLARTARKYKIDEQLDKFSTEFASKIGDFNGPIFSTANRVIASLLSVLTVFVMTFMMLVEGPLWLDRLWSLHPDNSKEKHRREIATKMYRTVTAYVNGQLIMATIAGTFALVALLISSTLLNVSINAVALAGIVAVFGIIPMIGNPLAAVVVVLACAFASLPLAIIMAIYFLVYFQIENVTLQPYIQSRQSELTPLIVFVSALIGIGFAGILGAFVAIPAAGCIKILVEDYAQHRFPTREAVEK